MLESEFGEYEEPYLKYCSSFPVFGPLENNLLNQALKDDYPPRCDVNNVISRLAFLKVVYPGQGEGPDLAQALGDPADHVVGGGPAVWHRQPVPRHQLQAVLGCELLVVINPAVSDILTGFL